MSVAKQLLRGVGRFARAESGVAAVEFAMLAAPFFWLMLGILEVTMIAFAQTSLDYALGDMARRIRTGEVQEQNMTEAQFKSQICDMMGNFVVIDCANMHIDVDSYQGFVNVQNPNPIGANGALQTGQFGYDPGTASSIVLVRGFYEWGVITPFLEPFFANVGRKRLLSSTILFRNEPWA